MNKQSVRMVRRIVVCGLLASGLSASAVTLQGPERCSKFLEYVSSDGAQSIDTGLALSSNMSVAIEFSLNELPTASVGIFGSRNGGASKKNITLGADSTGVFMDFNNSNYATYRANTAVEANVRYRAELSSEERKLTRVSDGVVLKSNSKACPDAFTTATTAKIFSIGGQTWANSSVKLYSLVIKSGDEVLRDYVPCECGGGAGLFDRAEVAYPEVYGGSLAGGPTAVTLPRVEAQAKSAKIGALVGELGASPLDLYAVYAPFSWNKTEDLSLVGSRVDDVSSQEMMIPRSNLGFPLTQDMTIDLTFSIEAETISAHNHGIFGARDSANANNIGIVFAGRSEPTGKDSIVIDFNNSSYSGSRLTYNADSIQHTMFRAVMSARERVLLDAKTGRQLAIKTTVCGDTITTKNAWLYNMNGLGGWGGSVNVYALTIKDGNGRVIHDYRPMTFAGVKGMVDRVTGTVVQDASAAGYCAGTKLPFLQKIREGVDEEGEVVGELASRSLEPETEYYFGLFAANGSGSDYATWACDANQRVFMTDQRSGLYLMFR